jgi:hypothetical protein
LLNAVCRLPPPSSSSLSTPPQPHQQRNHRRLTPVLLPPCDPPPPRRRHALSAFSIIHGAILDRHAASTSSGTTRRVPLPPAPPLSKDGPIAPAPPSRLPRCIGLLSGGRRLTLLCFSGCCRRSGDSNGSTLTLTLVPASGATTMKLSFFSPGLDGGGH